MAKNVSRPGRRLIVFALIVAAALSAAFARSNMAAVLSLGTVGYGVAVLYALLGAPDLAMTQFAVETLTVVIFVLVFYQLRGYGDLSSRLVKAPSPTSFMLITPIPSLRTCFT